MIILRQKEFASVRLAKKTTREYIKNIDANSKKAGFYKSVLDRNKLGLNNMYKNPEVVEKVTNPDPKVLKKYKKEIDKLSKETARIILRRDNGNTLKERHRL